MCSVYFLFWQQSELMLISNCSTYVEFRCKSRLTWKGAKTIFFRMDRHTDGIQEFQSYFIPESECLMRNADRPTKRHPRSLAVVARCVDDGAAAIVQYRQFKRKRPRFYQQRQLLEVKPVIFRVCFEINRLGSE